MFESWVGCCGGGGEREEGKKLYDIFVIKILCFFLVVFVCEWLDICIIVIVIVILVYSFSW